MKVTLTSGEDYNFIDECTCCELDTAGVHEPKCPLNPYYIYIEIVKIKGLTAK